MNWSNHLVLLPLFLTIIGCCVLVIYAWSRKHVPGRTPFILLNLAIIFWSFGNFLEITARNLNIKLFWANFEYFGIMSVPLIWLIFAIQYTGNSKWITPKNLALLMIVPVITIVLIWTDRIHGLMRYDFHLVNVGFYNIIGKTYGPAFWFAASYNYLLLIISVIIFLSRIRKPPNLSHGQVISLVICVLLPWLSNFLYITKLNPIPWMDLTPPSFALSAIVVAWGLIRFKLFDVVPIARDMVIEEMTDGVIVLNHEDIIVDMNSAALSIFNISRREVLGQPVLEILREWQLYVDRYKDVREISEELTFGTDDRRIYYDLRISPLYNRRRVFCGRLVLLRNITALKSAEAELHESENTLKTIFLAAPIGIGYVRYEELIWANDFFFEMMDCPKGEKFESINQCFETPEEFDRVKKTILEAMPANSVCDLESRWKTRTGRLIDVFLRAALVKRDDRSQGSIIAAVDMTERKRMIKEIQRVQNLESIGLLAGGIAHDFNNILTAILGNLTLARLYSPQKDKAYEKILEAEKASERAKNLTYQLLTFSKGGVPVKTTTTIDGLLKESTLFALTGSNVKCEFQISRDLWAVDADAGQINQVVHNLVLNADQAMPDGGILTVRAKNLRVRSRTIFAAEPRSLCKSDDRRSRHRHSTGIFTENIRSILYNEVERQRFGTGNGAFDR
ncbi:MAG: histidine kinase N-terminal 7TM domain-containing protein [Candidatus Neomarinimicrobiota bacterium]